MTRLEHAVQVFRSASAWTWFCDTCNVTESGYLKAAYAEQEADYHRTESACFDPRTAEWSPTPCEACKETA